MGNNEIYSNSIQRKTEHWWRWPTFLIWKYLLRSAKGTQMSRTFRIVPKSTYFALLKNDCRTVLGMAGAISAIIFTYESPFFIAKGVEKQAPKFFSSCTLQWQWIQHRAYERNGFPKPKCAKSIFETEPQIWLTHQLPKLQIPEAAFNRPDTRLQSKMSQVLVWFGGSTKMRLHRKRSCMGSYDEVLTSHTRETETSTTLAELHLRSSASFTARPMSHCTLDSPLKLLLPASTSETNHELLILLKNLCPRSVNQRLLARAFINTCIALIIVYQTYMSTHSSWNILPPHLRPRISNLYMITASQLQSIIPQHTW